MSYQKNYVIKHLQFKQLQSRFLQYCLFYLKVFTINFEFTVFLVQCWLLWSSVEATVHSRRLFCKCSAIRKVFHGAETNRGKVITGFQKLSFSKRCREQKLSCENEYYLHENKKKDHFHITAFALSLILKQRLGATRRGPTARILGNLLISSYDRCYKR